MSSITAASPPAASPDARRRFIDPQDPEVARVAARRSADLAALDRVQRRLDYDTARYVHEVELAGDCRLDGHRSVVAWGQATCNWSAGAAARHRRIGRALHRLPRLNAAAAELRVPSANLAALAAVVANPRVERYLDDSEELLVEQATILDHDDYVTFLRKWEGLADADGTQADHERAHLERHASISIVGARAYLTGTFGIADGTLMREILEHFEQQEFDQEWAAGLAEHGDAMCAAMMRRTPAQRRADAMVRLFRFAAGSPDAGGEICVNLFVDQTTLEHEAAVMAGARPAPLDPADVLARRCETNRGDVVPAADMLAAALIGHIRRVVLDGNGVVIDLGRRSRLFTGAARDAALMHSPRCTWGGCRVPGHRCQADHTIPFAEGGSTSPHNGGPLCGFHNLLKALGFRTRRHPDGTWHTYRPDGTDIGWRAAPVPIAGE